MNPWRLCTIRESGSVTLTVPAGSSGGVYGVGGAPNPRPNVSRAVARHASYAAFARCSAHSSSSSRRLASLQSRRASARHRLGLSRPFGLELPLRFAQPFLATLTRGQLLRQLVTALIAVELVLGRVDLGGLLKDLPRELLVINRLRLRRVRPATRVPSTAIVPTLTIPARAHNLNTCPNNPASAS